MKTKSASHRGVFAAHKYKGVLRDTPYTNGGTFLIPLSEAVASINSQFVLVGHYRKVSLGILFQKPLLQRNLQNTPLRFFHIFLGFLPSGGAYLHSTIVMFIAPFLFPILFISCFTS